MVVLLVSMLINALSLVMMLSVTELLVMTLIDNLNVLASLATLVLHALTTAYTKMVLIIATKLHHVPTPTVPTSMSALLNICGPNTDS